MTKFHAVRDHLLDRLESMSPGEPFPPERELAGEMSVSRMTLRRAIDELVAQGVVRRRHGSGVFALSPKLDQSLVANSFTEDMNARGLRPGSRTVDFEIVPAGTRISRRLGIGASAEVFHITRLRLADDEPIALEELTVPRTLIPELTTQDLENHSFYALLSDRCGISMTRSTQTIEPTVLQENEASKLEVAPQLPALLFERVSWGSDGNPVEFVRSVYRGDRYKIHTELAIPMARKAARS